MRTNLKHFILILTFTVLIFNAYSQKSQIYSDSGALLFDSAYSIDSERLEDFSEIEHYVLPMIYNKIVYPDSALWSGIYGSVIAKVTLHETGYGDVSIVKTSCHSFLDNSVITGINESMSYLKLRTNNMKLPFEFYIPFQFEFIQDTFREDLKRNNAVTIKDKGWIPIIYDINRP